MLIIDDVSLEQRLVKVNAQTHTGQIVHLVGENGAGKSTLLHILAGLNPVYEGRVSLNHKDLSSYDELELSEIRVMLEQHHDTPFSISVSELLSYYSSETSLPDEIENALEIRQFYRRSLLMLSGGEQRRVHIARCLLKAWSNVKTGKALVLLDEPFQGLDYRHQSLVNELLERIRQWGNLVILSVHDINLSINHADCVWLMHQGRLALSGTPSEVLNAQVLQQYWHVQLREIQDTSGVRYYLI